MKRFLAWLGLKQQLHEISTQPPLVSERDIWWASIGENVGSEIIPPRHCLQKALPHLLFRHSNHHTGQRWELVRAVPPAWEGHGCLPAPGPGYRLPAPLIKARNHRQRRFCQHKRRLPPPLQTGEIIFLAIAGEAAANAECALRIANSKDHASMANNNDLLTNRDFHVAEVILCDISGMALLSHIPYHRR
jgi:hypothetical protein